MFLGNISIYYNFLLYVFDLKWLHLQSKLLTMKWLSGILFLILSLSLYGTENPRTMITQRTTESIDIDGFPKEQIWSTIDPVNGFTQSEPNPESPASFDTEVKMLFDDEAIYFFAKLYDDNPSEIIKPFTQRDESSQSSWFGVSLDTYQSGVNGFAFIVTAAGVQSDMQLLAQGEDRNWDAVWDSKVQMVDDGWQVEIAIPFSMLRFPDQSVQEWNIQFGRQTRRLRESTFWNPLDPDLNGFVNQFGVLKGIENIDTPSRLSFTPFVVGGLVNTKIEGEGSTSSTYGAGMDMKLGLSESFTLDMTVIPDFSNTISDQNVLNLSPFEVFFEENRQFFTEGTELFNKGDFFYSRRIGASPFNPITYPSNYIIDNPSTNQLINASKISGRTKEGTGLGFFNAIEGRTNATVKNSFNGDELMIETNPLTNYNVLVVDQNLKNNSYFTLINTNVLREGSNRDANVTGCDFRLRDEEQKFEISGNAGVSQLFEPDEKINGATYRWDLQKIKGKWNFGLGHQVYDDKYDNNDLGFLLFNNQRFYGANVSFNQYEPKEKLLRWNTNLSVTYKRLYNPNVFSDMAFESFSFFMTRNFFAGGGYIRLEPIETYDYFEPRTEDFSRFLAYPRNFIISPFISSNWAKPFAIDVNTELRLFDQTNRRSMSLSIEPRLRLGDRLQMFLNFSYSVDNSDIGYISKGPASRAGMDFQADDILFGIRDRKQVVNTINSIISFNEVMSLSFRVRHYWDRVEYLSFGTLDDNGYLNELNFNGLDEDNVPLYNQDYDLFNIDMFFTWRFAPGSDIIFTWKNNGLNTQPVVTKNYLNALGRVYEDFNRNEVSLKVLYFLDANRIKTKLAGEL